MGHLGRQRFIGLGDRCRHRKARVRSWTSSRPAIYRSQTGVPLSESTHPEWAISATSNLPVVWDRCYCRKVPVGMRHFPAELRSQIRNLIASARSTCGFTRSPRESIAARFTLLPGPRVNMRGHSTGSPACWLSALFQRLFWTFGRSFDASDAEQPKVCCDQHGQQNRCCIPRVSVRRATHSFRDSNFRCRGWEAHHGGLTPAALGRMYVCASQKSLFRRQTFALQGKSGGVSPRCLNARDSNPEPYGP